MPFLKEKFSFVVLDQQEREFQRLKNEEEKILNGYSNSERKIIVDRLNSLKGTIDMVSADNDIQVFVNEPGAGWFWNYQRNYIRIDADALLHRPLEENRFFVSHEAAHRRLTIQSVWSEELRLDRESHTLF